MTFKLKCKSKGLKALFTIIPQFREEASFEVHQNKLKFVTMDASRNQFFTMDWLKENFLEYQYDGDNPQKITFNTNAFEKIVKKFKSDSDVLFYDTLKSTIVFEEDGSKFKYELRLNSLTDDDGFTKTPSLPFDNPFDIDIKDMQEMIIQSEVFDAEQAWLENVNGKLTFVSKGDMGKTEGTLLSEFSGEVKDTAYRFEYLKPFFSSIVAFAEPTLKCVISTAKPMIIHIDFKDVGIMEYFIGPQVPQGSI